ncbi:MAG TPA: hypothetical protein VHZ24_11580 [Pirellulales bacterium]|jgi:hypothetical protein|nr:hypothetical protein [Pirellulales bacterium]
MSKQSEVKAARKRFQKHADLQKLEKLLPYIRELQRLASQHGIHDVFQDNGGKLLQVLLVTGLIRVEAREGNDAIDSSGKEYELKSVNRFNTKGEPKPNAPFTTHHHLNQAIIDKYRKVDWIFAIYSGIELEQVYFIPVSKMEPCFRKWEADFGRAKSPLNNPKISQKFVRTHGIELYRNENAPKPGDADIAEVLGDVESSPTGDE